MRASAGSTSVDKIDELHDPRSRRSSRARSCWRGCGVGAANPAEAHPRDARRTRRRFGLHPVGTGPYKVESFDPATGNIVLVKNPDYNWGGYEPVGKIGRIEVSTIPDAQTRIAKIMVGDLDLIFNVDYNQAKAVGRANPDYKIVVAPTIAFSYILFDTADRSGIHVFKDKRVREALLRAIDVEGMREALLPPEYSAKPRDGGDVPSRACRLHLDGEAGALRSGAGEATA